MIWDSQFAFSILPALAWSFLTTIRITFEAFALSCAGAFVIMLALRGPKWISLPVRALSDFIRKTPILVQIYFLYYVMPGLGLRLTAWETGLIALALHYSFYIAGVYAGALDAIPRSQWEAANALGLRRWQFYLKIAIPQMLPIIVPNAGNYLIYMFKDTPYLAAITVVEVMSTASRIGSINFRYVEPITIAGLLFLLASTLSASFIKYLERLSRGRWSPERTTGKGADNARRIVKAEF